MTERLIENPGFEFLHDDGDGGSWMQEVDLDKPVEGGLGVVIFEADGTITAYKGADIFTTEK